MKYSLFFLILLTTLHAEAQQPASPAVSRSAILKANEAKLLYPFLKGSTNTGVMPVDDASFPFAYKGQVKLVYDLTQGTTDPAKGELNPGLEEVVRQLNLHAAAGVDPKRMEICIVIHGGAAQALTDHPFYHQKFQIDNPNMPLIQQLQEKKVTFMVCGQTIAFRNMKIGDFPAGFKKAYSARSALSDLQHRGFVLFAIDGEH